MKTYSGWLSEDDGVYPSRGQREGPPSVNDFLAIDILALFSTLNVKAKRLWKHWETMVALHILVGGGWCLSQQWTKGGTTRCSRVSLVLHLQCFLFYNGNICIS